MAMNNEAEFYADGESLDHTPSGALTAGDVVRVQGDYAGIVPTGGIAASAAGAIVTRGLAKIAAKAVVMSAGAIVGWDEDGNPYGGTAGGGAMTTKLAECDFLIGTLVSNVTATTGYGIVHLNRFPKDMAPILAGLTFETVSTNKTLDIEDVGKCLQVDTDGVVITLPATAAGLRFVVQNIAGDGVALVGVSPQASDKIMGADLAGTDDHDENNTKATAKTGDWIDIRYGSADGYLITGKRGIWTQA
jgi:hypothetical protein